MCPSAGRCRLSLATSQQAPENGQLIFRKSSVRDRLKELKSKMEAGVCLEHERRLVTPRKFAWAHLDPGLVPGWHNVVVVHILHKGPQILIQIPLMQSGLHLGALRDLLLGHRPLHQLFSHGS